MSTVDVYHYSSATSGATGSDRKKSLIGFNISGLTNGVGLVCCLYIYDVTNDIWIPYQG